MAIKKDNTPLLVPLPICEHCKKIFKTLMKTQSEILVCYHCCVIFDGQMEADRKMFELGKNTKWRDHEWVMPLPDNMEEIIKNRDVKYYLNQYQFDTDKPNPNLDRGYDELIDIIIKETPKVTGQLESHMQLHDETGHAKSKIDWSKEKLTGEHANQIFEELLKILVDYPEIPINKKNLMIDFIRKSVDKYIDSRNSEIENIVTARKRLIDHIKSNIKSEFLAKIEKTLNLWIDDHTPNELIKITNEEVLSIAEGAIHSIEKHKVKPNGFCSLCDEYYNDGLIKTELAETMEIIEESKQLYSKSHHKEDGSIDQQLLDIYEKKINKDFENTPQENVDEFLNEIKSENQKIKDEFKRVKQLKEEKKVMKTLSEAMSLIKKKFLFSQTDYENFTKSDDFPEDLHVRPDQFYKEWKDLGDNEHDRWKKYLGADKRLYDFRKDKDAHKRQTVRQILLEIEKRLDHYMLLTPGLLTNWFKIMGLFHHRDPGVRAFVKQFINTEKTPEGRKELQEALSRTIYNLQVGYSPKGIDKSAIPLPSTAKTFLDQVRSEKINYVKTALLEKIPSISVRFILENAREIVPMTKDTRWWNLHISFIVSMIWRQLFDSKRELIEIEHMMKEPRNGNAFHDEVMSRFWDEYNTVKSMRFWANDYNFRVEGVLKQPLLNQLYTAFKLRILNGFCNFGDPGIGKTNAALLATKIHTKNFKVKFTLIIAPHNVCKQWVKSINNIYPHSFVSIGKHIFKDWAKGTYENYYHVINYEKFSRDKGKLVDELANFQIDFVIIDEAHHSKIRDESNISNTRLNIEKLLDRIRAKNRYLKCLMLSATPIINNIREGKSLLEMVTGTKYPDLKTADNLGNATELHSEFVPFSVRYIKNYDEITQEGHDKPIFVDAYIPDYLSKEEVRKLSWMEFEQICTKARIPEIVKRLKKKTIIYCGEFVDGNPKLGLPILEQLKLAVEKAGFTCGFFTGNEIKPGIGGKGGLEDWSNCKIVDGRKIPFNPFVDGNLDVLIGSSSLSEGINELQYVCNNLILNGLCWTYAEFKQLVGRLVREGQKSKTVTISLILSRINGYDYDLKVKLNRLEAKRILGNCVTDGTLPDLSTKINTKSEMKKLMAHILLKYDSGIKIPIRSQ